MSVLLRRVGTLALAGLAVLGAPLTEAQAQVRPGGRIPMTVNAQSLANTFRINPNFYLPSGTSLNQYAYNVGTLGRAYSQIPPYMLGYNPYPQVANFGPTFPTISPVSPYGVGTPFAGGAATLATDPYAGGGAALSTVPGGPGYGGGGWPYYGFPYTYETPYTGYLRGTADLTAATGRYWGDIQRASLMREQTRQAAIDTRRRLMEEARYERMNMPTALTMAAAERATDETRARRGAPSTEVWSGRAMNDLLGAIPKTKLADGPSIPLEEDVLKGINLTDGGSSANLGLLKEVKDDGKLPWPGSLTGAKFDRLRKSVERNVEDALQSVRKDKQRPEEATLSNLGNNLKALNDLLNKELSELSPSQYIQARRFLNQLRDAHQALENPKVVANFTNRTPKAGTVAELVKYMNDSGLKFAPATTGDEAAYTALYNALRRFDAGMPAADAPPPPPK